MKKSSKKLIENLVLRYPLLRNCEDDIVQAIKVLKDCYFNNRKILVCGNGGSASDSLHIVGELMKNFVLSRELKEENKDRIKNLFPNEAEYIIANLQEAIPAISLINEVALTTAYGNDNTSDLIFAQQVYGYGKCGDVLIAISTSGNSKNVVNAIKIAKVKEMKIISLTGREGGVIKSLSDININVNEKETYIIQEYHLLIYHLLCLVLENELFGKES